MTGAKEWRCRRPVVVIVGEAMNRFDVVLHMLESQCVSADGVGWHTATADSEHTERSYDAVVTGGGVMPNRARFIRRSIL